MGVVGLPADLHLNEFLNSTGKRVTSVIRKSFSASWQLWDSDNCSTKWSIKCIEKPPQLALNTMAISSEYLRTKRLHCARLKSTPPCLRDLVGDRA